MTYNNTRHRREFGIATTRQKFTNCIDGLLVRVLISFYVRMYPFLIFLRLVMDDLTKTTARAEESHRRIEELKSEVNSLKSRLNAVEDYAYSMRGFVRVVGWLSLVAGFVASYLNLKKE